MEFKRYFEGEAEFVQPYEIKKILLFRTRQFENIAMSTYF